MATKDQALADRLAAHVKPAGRSSRRPKPEGIRVRKPRRSAQDLLTATFPPGTEPYVGDESPSEKGGATEAASPQPVTQTVAELKAIRMRAKWAAQRQERRIAKAKTPEEKAEAKTKTKELWQAERQAYAEYKAALKASKGA